jgi:peptidase E
MRGVLRKRKTTYRLSVSDLSAILEVSETQVHRLMKVNKVSMHSGNTRVLLFLCKEYMKRSKEDDM